MRISTFLLATMFVFSAVSSDAAVEYPFEGEFDFRTKELSVTFDSEERGKVTISNKVVSDNAFELIADFDHFKAAGLDFSSQLTARITKSMDVDEEEVYTGVINSKYMLVDFKPVRELSGSFFVKNKALTISSFNFAGVSCDGSIDFDEPYPVNMAVKLDYVPMDKFLDVWVSNRTYDAEGFVSGIVKVSGDADNGVYLKGKLDGSDGRIKTFDFEDIHLDIEGTYPHLQIAQSKALKKDGISFEFEGPINLKDKENFKKQIKQLNFMPVVRSNDLEHEWTIRQAKDDTTGTTSLKYLLRKEPDDVSGMLGIEKSLEF